MHLLIRLTHEDDQTSDFRVQPLTTAVLPQTKDHYRANPSTAYSIPAVLPQRSQGKSAVLPRLPQYYRRPHYRAALYSRYTSGCCKHKKTLLPYRVSH